MGGMRGEPAERLTVTVEHVPAPDAEERLIRAYRLALTAAARAESEVAKEGGAIQGSPGAGSDDAQ